MASQAYQDDRKSGALHYGSARWTISPYGMSQKLTVDKQSRLALAFLAIFSL